MRALLIASLLLGAVLRLTYVQDMEYKEDEEYNYTQSQLYPSVTDWPAVGMPSGVYLKNPGMSVWVFSALARVSGARTPTALARALQIFSLLGIALLLPFARWILRKGEDAEPWLWACALALVNPFAVFYQRKLWPEPFLPFFTMLTLMGWWRRELFWAAFAWGLVGAWLGQIHMSGFFFAAALFLWTLCFRGPATEPPVRTNWKGWFSGSVIGALPLVPWVVNVLRTPSQGQMFYGLNEALQLKFWVFWITDPLGLHLGNPLGLLRGQRNLDQISDFIRYPLVAGHATYLTGVAHFVVLGAALIILGRGFLGIWRRRRGLPALIVGRESNTAFVEASALWGFGLLLTLTTVMIRRYYMMVSFPLEFIWLVGMARGGATRLSRQGRGLLFALWLGELVISANFVGYIHVNEGALQGDYGPAYHVLKPH